MFYSSVTERVKTQAALTNLFDSSVTESHNSDCLDKSDSSVTERVKTQTALTNLIVL